ncbi:hypothetical protein [Spirillospora sp. NPDC029432]|uniref:RICIN domain-containing protein n=1 Tax=Spirillospora sp. NPDC029432 TaxID=3154599 RepID=UPI0034531D0D
MIKVRSRPAAIAAGSLAVAAVAAGVSLAGLPGGSAVADDVSPELKKRILEDCNNPTPIPDPDAMPQPPHMIRPQVFHVYCEFEPVEDLGLTWGEASKKWADGKNKEVPACEAEATASKSEAHTTGTNFHIGFQVQVDKEVANKIKPGIQARFGWTFVNTRTSTYGQSFTIKPFHMGWYEVRPALRKVKMNVEARYMYPGKPVHHLEGVELTSPDPETQDAWAGRTRPMTPEELKTFCNLDELPGDTPSDDPSDNPSDPPSDPPADEAPQDSKALVNVSTGRAADVDGGRAEVRAMPANQADGQKWNVRKQDDGRVHIEPVIKPGHALGKNDDPNRMDQGIGPFALISPDGKGAGQRWRLVGAGGDTYTIVDENGHCLTDPGNQGGTVGVFGCVGGDLQRWRLTGG